jgi:para-nitrobenzyl esterase
MSSPSTLARTSLGELQGLQDGGVSAWLGVPYAQPPVGAQRFKAAAPVQAWQGVRDATNFGAACPQKVMGNMKSLGPTLDEDCLTLNIWSPAADGKKRPVMVWVHGGAFLLGSARVYTGAHLAAQGDIVVVAINYRLGVFGFVNFGEALGTTASRATSAFATRCSRCNGCATTSLRLAVTRRRSPSRVNRPARCRSRC